MAAAASGAVPRPREDPFSPFLVEEDQRSDGRALDALSKREIEVLGLIAAGLETTDIARKLFIAPVTVRNHVRHIFEKMGVHSRLAAALAFIRSQR